MLPEKLQDILTNHDPEDIAISFLRVDYENENPSFRIQVSGLGYNDEKNYFFEWKINTVQYRSSKIYLDTASSIEISNDNPLLWYYSDKQCSMYFKGDCSDSDKLFLDLYRIHNSIFNGQLNFEDSLNQPYNFYNLIQSKNGLLAKGPRKLLEEYATILKRHNIGYTIIGDRIPQYWDGQNHKEEIGTAKILFIDNSYIIADEFNFVG
ncbi:hypothetical protein QTN47_21920 [Danxiaibacter flavus]|uniref:Uncharacterized protein n=1 Tax=Danxiaibacter flavus TaxID=3049108 RepID=A0ABV3ZNJ8_9BACT|nr:hypothetical protein QNM32_21925 [Chitinophagaceae bacterium DXS]